MLYSKKYSQLLARVNFPLYTIAVLSDRHVLFAGGGGGAKTGILNVIVSIFKFNIRSFFYRESYVLQYF